MTTDALKSPADTHARAATTDLVRSGPQVLLRLEGALVLAAAVAAYAHLGGSGLTFGLLFLLPDLSLLGYLKGARVGAAVYNAGHCHAVPATLAAIAIVVGNPGLLRIALIWVAHIGFDRMLGYGLKHGSGFGDTHLGRVGRR